MKKSSRWIDIAYSLTGFPGEYRGVGPLTFCRLGSCSGGLDFVTPETRVGALSFNAIYFGGRIRLSSIIQEHLACGDPHGINQCTLLRLCAALEWAMRNRPKRAPSYTRVDGLAKNLRGKEIFGVRKMISTNRGSPRNVEILSITHDVLSAHRDREFRTTRLYLLGGKHILGDKAIRIVEAGEEQVRSSTQLC